MGERVHWVSEGGGFFFFFSSKRVRFLCWPFVETLTTNWECLCTEREREREGAPVWLQVFTVRHGDHGVCRFHHSCISSISKPGLLFTELLKCFKGKAISNPISRFLACKEIELTFINIYTLTKPFSSTSGFTCVDTPHLLLPPFLCTGININSSRIFKCSLCWLVCLPRWCLVLHLVLLHWLAAAHQVTEGKIHALSQL